MAEKTIIEGILEDGEFRQTNGQSFDRWLAEHDREVEKRLIKNLEVMGDYLVVRDAHEAEYPAGPEYGPYPGSDAEPIAPLNEIAGAKDYLAARDRQVSREDVEAALVTGFEKTMVILTPETVKHVTDAVMNRQNPGGRQK